MRLLSRAIYITCTLSLCLTINGHATSIDQLIKKGRLVEAADSLSRRVTAATRDGTTLYYQSLLEPKAGRSRQLLEAALKSGVNLRYQEEIYLKLAQYYMIQKEQDSLTRIINDYRSSFEKGKYQSDMLRFSALADEMSGRHDAALRQVDRYLSHYSKSDARQWGTVDKARVMRANRKRIGADKILKKLSRKKKGAGVPQALYLLAIDAIKERRADDAVFLYNLMREAYPSSVGLNAIVERLGSLRVKNSGGNEAEKLTGTFYSVKVGVFTKKSNARKQQSIFKKYDKKVDIKARDISGRKYHVVYVGRFINWQKAMQFKEKLESTHDDIYQVVAR